YRVQFALDLIGQPTWIDDFNGDKRAEVLTYCPNGDNWWLGFLQESDVDGTLTVVWAMVGNSIGFGHNISRDRPFWTGNFSRADRTQILFYHPETRNWWLGTFDNAPIRWDDAGNSSGSDLWEKLFSWIGDFNGDGRADILFYSYDTDDWWLGTFPDPTNKIKLDLVDNTIGFGHNLNDGRPFWTGNFSRADPTQILFYHPGTRNWWVGTYDGAQLSWTDAGNTAGFGDVWDGRPFCICDFNADKREVFLLYLHDALPISDDWWLGTFPDSTNKIKLALAGNTIGFGHNLNDGRPFWTGN